MEKSIEKTNNCLILTNTQLENLVKISAQEGIKAYQHEIEKCNKENEKRYDKVRQTKKLLASYRRLKNKLENEELGFYTEDEKIELRWKFLEDLMGSARNIIKKTEQKVIDTEKKLQEERFYLQRIESAVELYRIETEKSNNEEQKRRFREIYYLYISDERKKVAEIAQIEHINEKTVYKDINIACKAIALYMLGI